MILHADRSKNQRSKSKSADLIATRPEIILSRESSGDSNYPFSPRALYPSICPTWLYDSVATAFSSSKNMPGSVSRRAQKGDPIERVAFCGSTVVRRGGLLASGAAADSPSSFYLSRSFADAGRGAGIVLMGNRALLTPYGFATMR